MRYKSAFTEKVYAVVAQIPKGRVMTYGQIAALIGHPMASRQVGGTAHFGDPEIPWQRVVNKQGGLASGYPGGRAGHKRDLEAEGVEVRGDDDNYFVDVQKLIWWPERTQRADKDLGSQSLALGETAE